MTQPRASKPATSAGRTALVLAGALVLVSACAQLPASPGGGPTGVPSSSQAADGPQTAAWTMQ